MAIAITKLVDWTVSANPTVTSGSVTPTAGSLLLLVTFNDKFPSPFDSTVGGTLSATWTKVGNTRNPSNALSTTLWKSTNATGSGTISGTTGASNNNALVCLEVTGSDNLLAQSGDAVLTFQVSTTVGVTLTNPPTGTTIFFCWQGTPRASSLTGTDIGLAAGSNGNMKASYSTPGSQSMSAAWGGATEQATAHMVEVRVPAVAGRKASFKPGWRR